MTTPTTIGLETPKRMTALQELDLVRVAHARNPASRELRRRLAGLLSMCDRHRETLTLLRDARADPDFRRSDDDDPGAAGARRPRGDAGGS